MKHLFHIHTNTLKTEQCNKQKGSKFCWSLKYNLQHDYIHLRLRFRKRHQQEQRVLCDIALSSFMVLYVHRNRKAY